MPKGKLKRFAENKSFPHLIQPKASSLLEHHFELKGAWSEHFGNRNPIIAELGCGRGEYTVGLAEKFPGKNFIGMDIKGARLWFGAKAVQDLHLNNVAFVRSRIDFIDRIFGENELSEIWITFPDPQPQKPRERKRLTSPRFLNRYQKILRKNGLIHLKTDNIHFYIYTLDIIREHGLPLHSAIQDIHNQSEKTSQLPWLTKIQTHYESIFLRQNIPIHYLCFEAGDQVLDESQSRAIQEVRYQSRSR